MGGKARGKTGTLTQEQLQTLGCVGKEMPQVQTAPPPTYPPLMTKPTTLETTEAQKYQILWKEAFLNHMRDSPYYLELKDNAKCKENLTCYRPQNILHNNSNKVKLKPDFNWSVMPAELNIINKKRHNITKPTAAAVAAKVSKIPKAPNIEDRLKELEEKERTEGDGELKDKTNSDSEVEPEEEVVDDEMDEENDYGNSYFDNGEAYNEEDDNLDDGPIY